MNTQEYKEKLKAVAEKNAAEEAFYTKCGEILNIPHEYNTPVPRRTRWNNRLIGNGRYKGFGTIHVAGSMIRVMDRKRGTFMFYKYEDVYNYLKGTIQ